MDCDDSTRKRQKALREAAKEMWKALESFGSTATLNFLISVSNQDSIVNELLPLFPSIAATAGFMSKTSSRKVGD